MKTSLKLAEKLAPMIIGKISIRPPDFIVGADHPDGPYLLRWYITPWRRWRAQAEANPTRWNRCKATVARMLPNLYLHCFQRDDDDRALHDHPSWGVSYILRGGYIEHTIAEGGIHHRTGHLPGSLRFMGSRHAHRVELFSVVYKPRSLGACTFFVLQCPDKRHCWTLFMFGPTLREWGFHCADRGWIHWKTFTAAGKPGEVGKGCDA